MKNLFLFLLLMLGTVSVMAQEMSARDIVEKADDARRGNSSYTEATMTVIRPAWQRSYSMKSWTKGEDFSLTKITAPAKDAGQGYLKIKNDLWNWIPTISRLIKMSSSVMGQSWMGSDLTNDDMLKDISIVGDYTHKLLGTEKIREYECWKVELVPMEDAAVVWSKSIFYINKSDFGVVKVENYDEEDLLTQEINNFDLQKYGKRVYPHKTEIIPIQEEGKKTLLTIIKAEYDQPIEDDFFSQQNLKTLK